MRNKKGRDGRSRVGTVGLIAVGAVALITYPAALHSSVESVRAHVEKTERVQTKNSSYYLVFTDSGVFKNSDSLIFGKFNSSDLYATLKQGEDYVLTVAGWRVPFLSMYPNIVKVAPQ